MGAARDLFFEVPLVGVGDDVSYHKLVEAAKMWRSEGQHFSAGIAMLRAADADWSDPDRTFDAYQIAMKDFESVLAREKPDSLASIAALFKLRNTLFWVAWRFELTDNTIKARARELSSQLAERLLTHFAQSGHADNYLVRGIVVATDLEGSWSVRFPPKYEVAQSSERFENQELILNVPSAFQLFVEDRDWSRAHDIVQLRPNGFTSPGLTGWRAVTLANVNPTEAVERFDDAADAFAADREPKDFQELMERGGQ